jgi:uncharacterized SAM-binding protein YcdF (DUF218 family)
MTLHAILWTLLSPSQLIIASVLLGILLLHIGFLRAGGILTIVGGLFLLAFGVLPTAQYLAQPLETRFRASALPPDLTGIVLLTGSERSDASQTVGQPQTGVSGGRYLTAFRLATQYPRARIVLTGEPLRQAGKGPLQTETAIGMRILDQAGIPPSRVTLEDHSQNTCDNAFNTYRLVQPKASEHWAIVTSALHMPRTMACFRAAGWRSARPEPADYWSVPGGWDLGNFNVVDNLAMLDAAAYEWVGLAYYRAIGRTTELFPAP